MLKQLPYPSTALFSEKNSPTISSKKLFRNTLLATLFTAGALLPRKDAHAQTIEFTSTPVTAAVENVNYSGSVMATISNNDEITFSAPVLPAWLTLNSSGVSNATVINNTTITQAAGVALDANGNYYVVQNEGSGIYKVTPDGTTTLWAQKPVNCVNYGAIVIDNYLYVSSYWDYYYYYGGNGESETGIVRYDLTQENPTYEVVYNTAGILSMTYKEGYLYAADYGQNRVLKINLEDNSVTTLVAVEGCFGLGFDPAGDLLIACYGYSKIVKYSEGTLTDVITSLPFYPSDVKIDAKGYIYISALGGKILRYSPDYSDSTEVSDLTIISMGLALTPTGTLVFGDYLTGNVYSLQTGAVISGKPSHEDVGQHPVKLIATNGTVSVEQEFIITVTDPNAPLVETYFPENQSEDVPLNSSLSFTFNETVVKGTGNIYLLLGEEDLLQTIDVTSDKVSISDKTVTVSLGSKLPSLTKIYITMDAGTFVDVNGNDYEGIHNDTDWRFKTIEQTQEEQVLTFEAARTVSYGTSDFIPGAVSDAGLEIVYTSSDESVAEIVDGKIRIKKAGVTTITATQEGNEDYFAAEPVTQELTVTKQSLVIKVENKSRKKGQSNPSFTFVYTGFVNGDGPSQLTALPQAQTSASTSSPMGKYVITAGDAASPNYEISYEDGELSVIGDKRVTVWASGANTLEVRIYSETAQKTAITLYTETGQPLVALKKQLAPGINSFTIPGINVVSNIYILYVNADKFQESQKVKIK